jgi:eukaryotic-like serine/threonine-protein kinase
MLEVGSLIAGKLRIERVIGRGGMGTVVIATHLKLDQRVAVKVLHTDLCSDPDVLERFIREARASARLRSEHVCRVTDVGQLETGEPYIEMELLEGSDLSNVIASEALPVEAAVEYVLQACVGVAEAHAAGIIHRDLKPANLFLTRRLDGSPLVKVLDFGIATTPSATDFKITRTTTVMGSPGYMSPEHLRSARDVDTRSDIWALGCILYEAVSGRLPFSAATITELAVKVVIDPPDPLVGVDPRFAAIVMRCLEKPPDRRYQSVAELAADLAPLGGTTARATATLIARLAGGPPSAAAASQPGAVEMFATTLHTVVGQTTTPAPRQRGIALIAAVTVLTLVGLAIAAMVVLNGPAADTPLHTHLARVQPDATFVAVADDAAFTIDAKDDRTEIRSKLHDLAQQGDWSAILTVSGLDSGDPEIATIVADAKRQYVALQTQLIIGEVARGDCAHARAVAAAAEKLVPDDTTLGARAKACAPRPIQTGPVSNLDAAKDARDLHDYAKALSFAEKAIAEAPTSNDAVREAALAACGVKDVDKARLYIPKLTGSDRNLAMFLCTSNGVKLGAPPRPPPPPSVDADAGSASPTEELAKDLASARAAERLRNWSAAAGLADKILKLQPRAIEPLRILGTAACHLKDPKRVKAALAKLMPQTSAAKLIHNACEQEGVSVD